METNQSLEGLPESMNIYAGFNAGNIRAPNLSIAESLSMASA